MEEEERVAKEKGQGVNKTHRTKSGDGRTQGSKRR